MHNNLPEKLYRDERGFVYNTNTFYHTYVANHLIDYLSEGKTLKASGKIIKAKGKRVLSERTIVGHYRCDVYIDKDNPIYIEIVNTRPITKEKVKEYRELKARLIVIEIRDSLKNNGGDEKKVIKELESWYKDGDPRVSYYDYSKDNNKEQKSGKSFKYEVDPRGFIIVTKNDSKIAVLQSANAILAKALKKNSKYSKVIIPKNYDTSLSVEENLKRIL